MNISINAVLSPNRLVRRLARPVAFQLHWIRAGKHMVADVIAGAIPVPECVKTPHEAEQKRWSDK